MQASKFCPQLERDGSGIPRMDGNIGQFRMVTLTEVSFQFAERTARSNPRFRVQLTRIASREQRARYGVMLARPGLTINPQRILIARTGSETGDGRSRTGRFSALNPLSSDL